MNFLFNFESLELREELVLVLLVDQDLLSPSVDNIPLKLLLEIVAVLVDYLLDLLLQLSCYVVLFTYLNLEL